MFTSKRAMKFLQISLGIYFLWAGILKLFASGETLDLIQTSLPAMIGQSQVFTFLVAFVEILIGVSYLANKLDRIASGVMIVSVAIISIPVFIFTGFDPRFPVLSLSGEFVLKNLILIGSGLVLLTEKEDKIIVEPEKKKPLKPLS